MKSYLSCQSAFANRQSSQTRMHVREAIALFSYVVAKRRLFLNLRNRFSIRWRFLQICQSVSLGALKEILLGIMSVPPLDSIRRTNFLLSLPLSARIKFPRKSNGFSNACATLISFRLPLDRKNAIDCQAHPLPHGLWQVIRSGFALFLHRVLMIKNI